MPKVVFLAPSLGMGGMERVLVNYANLFVSRGYDVTVLNFSYDDPAIVRHFHPSVRYCKSFVPVPSIIHASIKDVFCLNFRFLPWAKWIRFHSAEYLYKRYIRDSYDVEIAFFGSESIKIISGSDNKKAVKIGWIHNVNLEDDIPPLGTFDKANLVYQKIDNLICVSSQAAAKVKEIFGRTERVYAVNNPNDADDIRTLAKEKPENIRKTKFTFVNVSRIDDHQKGFLRLFSVCHRLNEEGFDYALWIVGDGIDYTKVKDRARELNLSNVTFFGKQPNPYPYMANADMYICSSYFEGFSMVMMETVILGIPMISTDVSGARDMLGDSEYGLIVDNNEDGLYQGMKKILLSEDLYRHYQTMAEKRKNYLDENDIMNRVEQIIRNGKRK